MCISLLQMTFDIPNAGTLKHKCLSAVAEDFRGFKTKLTSRYIYGSKKNEDPRELYKVIDEDTWRQFVESHTSEGWKVSLLQFEKLLKLCTS